VRPGARAAAALCAALAAGCGNGGGSRPQAPTSASVASPSAAREARALVLAAPPHSLPAALVARFSAGSGCRVERRPLAPGAAAEAFDAGADVVWARGDEASELVAAGRAAPLERARLPALGSLLAPFRHPSATTAGGATYGVPVLWSALVLLSSTRAFHHVPPASWRVLFQPSSAGRVAMLDEPLVLGAAARYLGVGAPFALGPDDLRAAVTLLDDQRNLGQVVYEQDAQRLARRVARGRSVAALGLPVAGLRGVTATVPREGTVGWVQELLVAPGSAHAACAYRLLAWVLGAQVQGKLALADGASPVNPKACDVVRGACALLGGEDRSLLRRVAWAEAPTDPSRKGALAGAAWQRAWEGVVGGH
jgi:spermidine/putrescine-binding protein